MAIPVPRFKPGMQRFALSGAAFLAIVLNGQMKIRNRKTKKRP
jgi:hypothetical protein